jgi:hypothetical protein
VHKELTFYFLIRLTKDDFIMGAKIQNNFNINVVFLLALVQTVAGGVLLFGSLIATGSEGWATFTGIGLWAAMDLILAGILAIYIKRSQSKKKRGLLFLCQVISGFAVILSGLCLILSLGGCIADSLTNSDAASAALGMHILNIGSCVWGLGASLMQIFLIKWYDDAKDAKQLSSVIDVKSVDEVENLEPEDADEPSEKTEAENDEK